MVKRGDTHSAQGQHCWNTPAIMDDHQDDEISELIRNGVAKKPAVCDVLLIAYSSRVCYQSYDVYPLRKPGDTPKIPPDNHIV